MSQSNGIARTKASGKKPPRQAGANATSRHVRIPPESRHVWIPASAPGIEQVETYLINASPENNLIYRPINPDDPEIVALAKSIRQHGILEPLVISADNYIVSGHRRFAAAERADLDFVPCRRLTIRRSDDIAAWVRLLREHNRQRDKTNAEKLREEMVTVNPENEHASLIEYRRAEAALDVTAIEICGTKHRAKFSDAKRPFLDAVKKIINGRRKYWPLTLRQVHYALLNDPPLRNARIRKSRYCNDDHSYKDLSDVLTRARLDGTIPFKAIADETRPVKVWPVHQNVRSYVKSEFDGMFRTYWRDLMQSQPNHIELIDEKNTAAAILKPVASDYTIPFTSCRGYSSIPPRHGIAERYRKSGKNKLVLLVVSDFDCEGEDIAHSFARSVRDDFDIPRIHPVKVALTAEQVKQYELPPMMKAKKTSSRYDKFVERHGDDVFELEALDPAVLQQIVREAIESVIDRDAFDAEVAAERADSVFLAGVRQRVKTFMLENMPDFDSEDE